MDDDLFSKYNDIGNKVSNIIKEEFIANLSTIKKFLKNQIKILRQ